MEVNADFLSRLMEVARSSQDVGICTCKMKRITEKGEKLNEIDSVGADIDIYGFPSARGINQKDVGQLDKVCEVFFAFGGAMLVKRSVAEMVRGYDSSFFTLADDIDLSWRVRLAGYRVMVQPSAVLYHRVSATLGRWTRARRRFISERNTFRMLLKNYSLSSLGTILPRYLWILLAELLFFAIRKPEVSAAYIKALGWNLLNLRDTFSKRVIVQATRIVSDKSVRKHMINEPLKINVFREFISPKSRDTLKRYLGE
jgi:GT2 family glycosyltransferase